MRGKRVGDWLVSAGQRTTSSRSASSQAASARRLSGRRAIRSLEVWARTADARGARVSSARSQNRGDRRRCATQCTRRSCVAWKRVSAITITRRTNGSLVGPPRTVLLDQRRPGRLRPDIPPPRSPPLLRITKRDPPDDQETCPPAEAAGCAHQHCCDGEAGADTYCAAADGAQARRLWDVIRRRIVAERTLRDACQLYQRSIVIESMGSSSKAIFADATTNQGYNSHLVVVDEPDAEPERELVDVFLTSTGARRQPVLARDRGLRISPSRRGSAEDPPLAVSPRPW